jgi:CheY-like chemotaxis protein
MFPRILIVDDNLDDQFVQARTIRKIMPRGALLNCANSGEEAISYLIGEGKFSDRERFPFPTLLITDLNMPNGDGLSLLAFINNNPAWSVVPRIVFSSSTDDDDVRTAFMLGASAYHRKPLQLADTEKRLASILAYWSTSLVPPVDSCGRLLVGAVRGTRGNRYPPAEGNGNMERPPPA